jgi:hypothetical protein
VPEGLENGRKAGASSSSSASSFLAALCEVNRGGRLNKRLSTGSESDEESAELESAASDDEAFFALDKPAVFDDMVWELGRIVDGGDIESRCRVAFIGRGLVCGRGLPCMVCAEDVLLSGGATESI